MHPEIKVSVERVCPACNSRSHLHFSDKRIDSSKISEFLYASRKQPGFMCLRLVRCTDCDLIYAPTPPPTDFLLKAYSEAGFVSIDLQSISNITLYITGSV